MTTYISLFRFTDKGLRAVMGTVELSELTCSQLARHGGLVKALYWSQGSFDIMAITEWQDEDEAAACFLRIRTGGLVEIETHRSFSRVEMTQILSRLRPRPGLISTQPGLT